MAHLKTRGVAILGGHIVGRSEIPFDSDWEIWGINSVYMQFDCKRWDRWFQMHNRSDYESSFNNYDPNHWEWLQKDHGKPIYMHEPDSRVPNCTVFPRKEIQETILQNIPMPMFGCAVTYPIAMAIHEKFDVCGIYGVNASDDEYNWQREAILFWIGVASQHMKVILPKESALSKPLVYGLQRVHRLRWRNLSQWLKEETAERGRTEQNGDREDFLIQRGRVGALKEVYELAKQEEKLKERW